MHRLFLVFAFASALLFGCASEPKPEPKGFQHTHSEDHVKDMRDDAARLAAMPEHTAASVEVQHLLVSFAGAGTEAQRTKQEAENLAAELYARVLKGEDFNALITQYTDDSPPGIYAMVADKEKQDMEKGLYWRKGMVPAFGDVAWRLEAGEIAVAVCNEKASPYGWHIIKRTK
ncbi:hypothetical protein PLCT1_00019 [Planctomycetaceae bacterium]|nr:hypothetical protein PLCT1_00019 [Planctomycetaceae bacterium]